MEQHLFLVTLKSGEENKRTRSLGLTCVTDGCRHKTAIISSHCAGVHCQGTLDEVELQYSGLQEGLRRDRVFLLLLFLSSPLLFARENP